MKRIKIISLLIIVSSLLLSGCAKSKIEPARPEFKTSQASAENNYNTPIKVGTKNLLVEVARTDQALEQGLSYRKNLDDGYGMLFDFTNTINRMPNFWMKDMNFGLDIIWISDKKIIGIEKNVPAQKNNYNLPTYAPPSKVDYVLEVPSGWCEKNQIRINDLIEF
jgi:uncharacterized membrane protein (UPF0127 family)